MMNALVQLSEGKRLDPANIDKLNSRAADFLDRVNIGYVVIDHTRSSPDLVEFATRAFRLEPLEVDGALVLFRPGLKSNPLSASNASGTGGGAR